MILVTTPGKVGREAARLLDENSTPVRLLARDPDKETDLLASGVQVISGDLEDDASVTAAIKGVTTVILVTAPVLDYELRIITAAQVAGTAHIVKITSSASPDSPIARRRDQAAIEQALLASSLHYTLLRNNVYMQNLLMLAPVIARTGRFGSSAGNGRIGFLDSRDVAAAAATIATAPQSHRGHTYRLTGPELLSYSDVAAILANVLDRPISFGPRTSEQDKQAMIAAGVPAQIAEMNAQAFGLIAAGDAEWQTDDASKILGRPSGTFEQFARDHAAAFTPSARPDERAWT
jgi:uncharacterized protein YbjT (DUF2867 family)